MTTDEKILGETLLKLLVKLEVIREDVCPTGPELVAIAEESMTRPMWWPKNPYPESVFPMTDEEYIKAIPDPVLRTAISGYSGRWVFEMASRMFYKAWREHEEAGEA